VAETYMLKKNIMVVRAGTRHRTKIRIKYIATEGL
jgi:hypothetical protein